MRSGLRLEDIRGLPGPNEDSYERLQYPDYDEATKYLGGRVDKEEAEEVIRRLAWFMARAEAWEDILRNEFVVLSELGSNVEAWRNWVPFVHPNRKKGDMDAWEVFEKWGMSGQREKDLQGWIEEAEVLLLSRAGLEGQEGGTTTVRRRKV